MYGLMLLLAIVAARSLTGIRWTRRGGDWDLVFRVAVWGVAFGIVGARALPRDHELERGARRVVGRLRRLEGRPRRLGRDLPRRRRGRGRRHALRRERARCSWTPSRPGLLLAQAIGRWGNWFNQELFGKPTDLPWGLEIDPSTARQGYASDDDVPPDLPLRVRSGTCSASASCCCSTGASASGRRRCSRSTSLVHGVPRLRGDAAHRPVAPLRRPAPQLLVSRRALRAVHGVLRLVAVHPRSTARRSRAGPRAARRPPGPRWPSRGPRPELALASAARGRPRARARPRRVRGPVRPAADARPAGGARPARRSRSPRSSSRSSSGSRSGTSSTSTPAASSSCSSSALLELKARGLFPDEEPSSTSSSPRRRPRSSRGGSPSTAG